MRVLVVESPPRFALFLKSMLRKEGLQAEVAQSLEEMYGTLRREEYDLALLTSIGTAAQRNAALVTLRESKHSLPVVVLSREYNLDAKVEALESGADDYIVQPVHQKELLARMRAVVRRAQGYATSIIQIGNLSIYSTSKEVRIGETSIHLRPMEFDILEILALRKDKVVTRESLYQYLYAEWNLSDQPQMRILDVHVCHIRKTLNAASAPKETYIETVWGQGYILREPKRRDVAA